jgi:hypothetical protein
VAKDSVVYRTEVRFNAIYVIESLKPGDPKTGTDLYDQTIYPVTRRLDGLHAQFFPAQNRDDLIQRLADIGRAVRLDHRLPLIHIEAHGTDDGLELADETQITWRELVPILGDINQACRMHLIVVAISCRGANLLHALLPADRAPLFMLVGPRGDMTHAQLLEATSRFYEALVEALLAGEDINGALNAMNNGLDYDQWLLRPYTAEILCCRAFRQFLEQETPEERSEYEDKVVAEVAREQNLDVLQAAALRQRVRLDLLDREAHYDRIRETFLMLDLFPENRPHFGLTFERCIEGTAVS